MDKLIQLEKHYAAHNYNPIPVVLTRGEGIHVWDIQGKSYIDMMGAYSAVSHGHCHPKLVATLTAQAQRLAVPSRAYYSDRLGPFLEKICHMTGMPKALPMNSGAEAVETAIKATRKWGYKVKGIPAGKAEIIACEGNFHGRTITMVAMSSEPQYRDGFDPFPEGFKLIPFGNAAALEKAITPHTAAFLVEPIQGEAGIIVPPLGYLRECAEICRRHNVLLICDEIQTGLGRTGKFLACEHENVKPDGITLGKALGGGLLAVSLFLAREDVMAVFTPGDHGSTFGGNPLAAAVGLEALKIIEEDHYVENSAKLGTYLIDKLKKVNASVVTDIRGKGLFVGLAIDPARASARAVCIKLMEEGILSKETHATVVRLAPPLIITQEELDQALAIISKVLLSYE